MGFATLNLAVGEACRDAQTLERSSDLFRRGVELSRGNFHIPSIFSGLAGLVWSLVHAARILRDRRPLSLATKIVAALRQGFSDGLLADTPDDVGFGLAGVGIAALAHGDETGDYALLPLVCDALRMRAEYDQAGACWYSHPHRLPAVSSIRYPHGCHDFGAAHGQVGVIAMLARACPRIQAPQYDVLCRKGLEWLYQARCDESFPALLPSIRSVAGVQFAEHSGWCYGDLGSAAVIYKSCLAKSNPLPRELVSLLLQRTVSAYRRGDRAPSECQSLCHGFASTCVLVHQLSTALAASETIALRENQLTLDRLRQIADADWRAFESKSPAVKSAISERDAGMLMGDSGVILAALMLTVPNANDWWMDPLLLSTDNRSEH